MGQHESKLRATSQRDRKRHTVTVETTFGNWSVTRRRTDLLGSRERQTYKAAVYGVLHLSAARGIAA
jgi:hypothetical protein